MRRQEIEHRGHESLALGELQLAHGHVPAQDVGMFAALEMVALAAAELGALDRNRVIAAFELAQPELDLCPGRPVPPLDVPLSVLAPAKADCAVGAYGLAAVRTASDRVGTECVSL